MVAKQSFPFMGPGKFSGVNELLNFQGVVWYFKVLPGTPNNHF